MPNQIIRHKKTKTEMLTEMFENFTSLFRGKENVPRGTNSSEPGTTQPGPAREPARTQSNVQNNKITVLKNLLKITGFDWNNPCCVALMVIALVLASITILAYIFQSPLSLLILTHTQSNQSTPCAPCAPCANLAPSFLTETEDRQRMENENKSTVETSSTTSPETDGLIGQLIRSLLSMMNDPDLQNLEDQHLLNIMLINIVNATYSRHTHRMETETEAIRQNTSNNVQKIRKSSGKSFLPSFGENFSDGGEEMENENKSTVNIAKMVNGLATSSHDDYVNKADTYNLDVEKHSSGTESVEVDDSLNEINKFMLDLNRAVSGTGYANTDDLFNETKSLTLAIERQVNNGVQSIHDSPLSKTLKIVIDKRVIGVATPDINDSLNKTAIFKVNIKKEVSGQGYSDSIYSSGGAELFEISIEKTVTGIPFLNTSNQALDDNDETIF